MLLTTKHISTNIPSRMGKIIIISYPVTEKPPIKDLASFLGIPDRRLTKNASSPRAREPFLSPSFEILKISSSTIKYLSENFYLTSVFMQTNVFNKCYTVV